MDPVDIEALRRQSDEALLQAISDPERALIATVAYQMIIECKREAEILAKSGEKNHPPKIDLVEEHRVAIETNFRRLGSDISVPRPDISNTTLKRWRRGGPRAVLPARDRRARLLGVDDRARTEEQP